jgi:hypothetical protein
MKPKIDHPNQTLSKLLKESPHSSHTWILALDEIDALEIAKLAATLHPHFKTTEKSIFKAAELLISTIQLIPKINELAFDFRSREGDTQPYTLEQYKHEKNFESNRPIFHRIRKTLPTRKAEILIKKLKSGEASLIPEIREKMDYNLKFNMSLRRGSGKVTNHNVS